MEHHRREAQLPMEFGGLFVSHRNSAALPLVAEELGLTADDIEFVVLGEFRYDNGKLNRHGYGEYIRERLAVRHVTDFTQNGFDLWMPDEVTVPFEGHAFNQHPAMVPEVGGKWMRNLGPYAAALYIGRRTGRMQTFVVVHRVSSELDKGATVKISDPIPILPSDTPERLQNRGKKVERTLNVAFMDDLAHGTVQDIMLAEPYIRPGEEQMLEKALRDARRYYPRGDKRQR